MKKFYQLSAVLLLIVGGIFASNEASAQAVANCFPLVETFDQAGGCPSSPCNSPCSLAGIGWNNPTDDTQDWIVWSGATTSGNTGPSADHTSGAGNYIYMETSSPCFGADDTAHVESPIIDATGFTGFYMSFWRHLYGATVDSLHIDARVVTGGIPGPWNLDIVMPYGGSFNGWLSDTLDLSAYAGGEFQIRFRAYSGTSFTGDIAIDDVAFFPILAVDAGISVINSPFGSVVPGPAPLTVTIQNIGSDTLTSVDTYYSLNGGAPVMGLPWTGSLVSGQSDGPYSIGNINIPVGTSTIKAWTENPNGVVDLQMCNDSAETFVCTPYSGNYNVGAGQFFTSPEDAANKLSTCGINGNVNLTIFPGTYQGRVILTPIPGAGPNATVTFDGVDTSLVTVEAASFSTVFLDGADYVTFKRMTIRNTGSADAWGVMLQDTAEYNRIDSCRIQVFYTNNADVSCIVASSNEASSFGQGYNSLHCTFANNSLEGGYYGVRFTGTTTYFTPENRFINNDFSGQEYYCFYAQYQDSIEIINNTFGTTNNVQGDGIYMFDQQNFIIEGNDLSDMQDYGMYIADGNFDFLPTRRGRIVNNFISSRTDRALYVDDFQVCDIWNNTMVGTYGFYCNDLFDVDFRNNICVGTSLYSVYSLDQFNLYSSTFWDYNTYYHAPSATNFVYNGGQIYNNLGDWQAAYPGDNISSNEGDPVFTNGIVDLHTRGPLPNDAGDNAVNLLVDIDGDMRPMAPSLIIDIGADEYTPLANDAVFLSLLAPTGRACGDSSTNVVIEIQNLGATPITSMPITMDISGDINTQLNFTYTGSLGFAEKDTVTVGTINTYAGATIMINGWVSLTGDQLPNNDTLNPGGMAEFIPFEPVGVDGYGCGTDSAEISGVQIPGVEYWFFGSASPADTNILGLNTYTIPSITAQSTYYIQYASTSDSLFTTNAAGNGSNGNMFDLVALQDVSITGFSMALDAGTHNAVVYYRPSPHAGFENSSAGWILLDSVSGINSTGPVPATLLSNGNFSVTIPAGQTYSFCVFSYNGNEYTNGSTVGAVFAQNNYFQFLEGVGKGTTPFGSTFSPRIFNGVIHFGGQACSDIRTPVSAVIGQGITTNIGPDTSACGPISLDAGNPGASYAWSNGDMTQVGTATMSGPFSVVVTDTNGCMAMDTALLTINPLPVVNLGADTAICNQNTVMLDAGNPGAGYTWSTTETTQMITAGPGMYTVVVTDSIGCEGMDTIDIAGVGPEPDLGADTTLCDGAVLNLDAGPGTSYAWSTSDTSQTVNVSSAATYSVAVTDSQGCMGMDTIVVGTETTPVAAFTFTVGGAGLVYDFTYTGTTNATTYAWDFGDGSPIDNSQNPSHTYGADGSYAVILIITNECGADTIFQNVMVVGNLTGLAPEMVDVFPNPNNGRFTVAFTSYDISDVQVEIFNLHGQLMHAQLFEQVNGSVKEQITLEHAASGVYFVRFSTQNQVVNRRITVE